jgi:outer membrane lipase/esterase
MVPTAFTADLPGRAPPPVPMAVLLGSPVSLFAEGGYANGSRESRYGAPGFDYDAPSVTVGAEYRARPDLLLGAAFNYSNASTNLTALGLAGSTRIDVNAYQFAGFASLNRPDWFADLVVGYGFNDFDVSRAGIVDRLNSTPTGNTLLVAAKAAYLFDVGSFRIGPLGTLTYAHTWIDAYREQGDPLLTQSVGRQDIDGLTGGAGIQIRLPFEMGNRVINPFVNVTAEHDFLGQLRTITTAQTYALALPISTSIRGYEGGTYGKVAAGVSFDLGGGLSAMVNGSATFARANGDDFGVNGGFRYRF